MKINKKTINLRTFRRNEHLYDLIYRFCWGIVQGTIFRFSPRIFWLWRRTILRLFGAEIGAGVKLDPTCRVYDPRKVTIGDNCWIGPANELYSLSEIKIGNNVALAQHVLLYTVSHDIYDINFETISTPIIIEDCVWLAADTFVGMGVTIGEGAVLGARSSAFKDIPPWTVCVGCPAKPIKKRLLKSINENNRDKTISINR